MALLDLRLSKPNFYILDEPTNHLDIQGQEDLEDEFDNENQQIVPQKKGVPELRVK